MTLLEALVLGVLQGATEFLPVSSSGHLVLGQTVMGLRIPGVTFEVAVHVATLVSVLVVYRSRAAGLLVGAARGESGAWGYLSLLVLATIPAAALGLLLKAPIEGLFEAPGVVAAAFLATGALLWTTRRAMARSPEAAPGLLAAVVMGLAQAVALVPGVSRSGTTVVAGLWSGVEPEKAAEFSFLMAVPAIGGAAILQIPELLAGGPGLAGAALLAGSVAAGVTGVLAIRAFVVLLRRRTFYAFAPYLWAVGLGFGLYLWVT